MASAIRTFRLALAHQPTRIHVPARRSAALAARCRSASPATSASVTHTSALGARVRFRSPPSSPSKAKLDQFNEKARLNCRAFVFCIQGQTLVLTKTRPQPRGFVTTNERPHRCFSPKSCEVPLRGGSRGQSLHGRYAHLVLPPRNCPPEEFPTFPASRRRPSWRERDCAETPSSECA